MELFSFHPDKPMLIGCEREFFLTGKTGMISPLASKASRILQGDPAFGYELSACQFEMRVGPSIIGDFEKASWHAHKFLVGQLGMHDIYPKFITVAPEDMPLDVYPDPTGRYQEITRDMPVEILRAACRVAGTHFHVGMPDHETALRVYNRVIGSFKELCEMGNLSRGERMAIYQIMAKDNKPIPYSDWDELYWHYSNNGYDHDPRKCWHLIRISAHGTIEFRMFDNTDDLSLVNAWGKKCFELCLNALS